MTFEWVKGHNDDPMNDVVDRLATEAAATQQPRSGSEPPTTLGPADQPVHSMARKSTATKADDLPVGWCVVVLGHRPPELGGYDPDNPIAAEVLRKMTEIVKGLLVVHPNLLVITGLGLGAEQIGAEAAVAAGVPYAAVLAYPDMDSVWKFDSQRRFWRLVSGAVKTITLTPKKPLSKQEAGMGIGKRNAWLVDHADGAIVVSNGKDLDLNGQIAVLEARVPDEVWTFEP